MGPRVLAQELAPEEFEVLVVDDDPSGSARAATVVLAECARSAGTDVIYAAHDRNRGPAAARNLGCRLAKAPVIAFTDDDCIPQPSWLSAGLAIMGHEGVDGAAGRIVVPVSSAPTDYEATMKGLEASAFATANCFYKRDALQRVGGFNEHFTMAWREDSDLQFRLLQSGARLEHAHEAVVVHPVRPAPWGISLREQRKAMFNALLYRTSPVLYRQHVQSRPPLKYYAILASAIAVGAGLLLRRPRLALAGAGLWAVLTTEFAMRRLRGTRKDRAHVTEMAVTSALIPPLAISWRLRGAIRHRVLFL